MRLWAISTESGKEAKISNSDHKGPRIGFLLMWGLNIAWLIITGLIVLAPYLASHEAGFAGFIYIMFKPTCHQLAHRSFFIFGNQMAVCARCFGIWTSLAFWGLIYGTYLSFRKLKPLHLIWFGILLLPMAIDGGTQLIGLRESSNEIRMITAFLLGFAVVRFTYPKLREID